MLLSAVEIVSFDGIWTTSGICAKHDYYQMFKEMSLTLIEATVVEILATSDAGALLGGLDKFNIMIISINLGSDKTRTNEQEKRTQNRRCLWDYPYHPHRRSNHTVLHYHRYSTYR